MATTVQGRVGQRLLQMSTTVYERPLSNGGCTTEKRIVMLFDIQNFTFTDYLKVHWSMIIFHPLARSRSETVTFSLDNFLKVGFSNK